MSGISPPNLCELKDRESEVVTNWLRDVGGDPSRLSEERFKALQAIGPQVASLDLSHIPLNPNAAMLFELCPQVTDLNLCDSDLNDGTLELIAAHLLHLQRINLGGVQNVTEKGLTQFVQNRPGLLSVDFPDQVDNPNALVSLLLRRSPKLEHIGLWNETTDDSTMELLSRCPSLQSVHSTSFLVSNASFGHLSILPNLRAINFIGAGKTPGTAGGPAITDTGVSLLLQQHQNLEQVRLSQTEISDAGVALFRSCPRLTYMDLSDNWNITDIGIKDLLAPDVTPRQPPHLIVLNISGCALLTHESMQAIATCHDLRELDISECTTDNRWLEPLISTCPDLRTLRAARCAHIDDHTFASFIQAHPKLRQINAVFTHFGDRSLAALGTFCHHLESAIISDTPAITNKGIMAVRGCQNLKHLALEGCHKISAGTIKALVAELPQLRQLTVDTNQLPDIDQDELRSNYPHLELDLGKPD